MQRLQRCPQPFRASGLPHEAVDVPLLHHAQPLPPALRREHLRGLPARRAHPAVHHSRVRIAEPGSGPARVRVRGGLLHRRGGAGAPQRRAAADAQPAAGGRAGGLADLRHSGARARARFRRLPQELRVPGGEGVHPAEGAGHAGHHAGTHGAGPGGCGETACGGSLPDASGGVHLPARAGTGGSAERPLALPARRARAALHRHGFVCSYGAAGVISHPPGQ
mmetsp:Transcript_28195/g.63860  ORF Transcript_28195/g.63860 Transcript_28195/m.63860 type:complete len:222 (-) Transcript_28195:1735-2400(-)